jgi:hypothetical protein
MTAMTAILSMLHETDTRNSARRELAGRSVLGRTLQRLKRCTEVGQLAILCWEDQLSTVRPIAEQWGAYVLAKGPRIAIPAMDAITAARRWANGWRGGLLQSCEFDRGFNGPWVLELADKVEADGVVLIDPSAGWVDAELVDGLVRHANENRESPLVFSQAAPGLSGVVIQRSVLEQLASAQTHPGRFLQYQPQQPCRDPIGEKSCAPVPTAVARTLHRFTLDSGRQLNWMLQITDGDDSISAAELIERAESASVLEAQPRELVLEITAKRSTRPVFSPAGHFDTGRDHLSLDAARHLFDGLTEVDDLRLTLGGMGDPLLSPHFFEIVGAARRAGISAIHVRTDLLEVSPEFIAQLARTAVDVISIQIPAITAKTYAAVMGVDGLSRVLENVKIFVEQRWSAGRAIPILVPVFTKCQENLGEMEVWYDKWLAALGSAVIAGASDYAGQIPDHAVADMSPPARRACGRLKSQAVVLSDGKVVACEQDAMGKEAFGDVTAQSITEVWGGRLSVLREDHRMGRWNEHALCAGCREWHRP